MKEVKFERFPVRVFTDERIPRDVFVMLHAAPVASSVSTSDIERDFYDKWAQGDRYWWWICLILVDPLEVIVNDGDDNLYRMAVIPDADGNVSFGEMIPVKIEFVDKVATRHQAVDAVVSGIVAARGKKVAAKYNSRAESRHNVEGDAMREKIAKLRAKLGLGDDVSDEEVLAAALEAAPETEPPEDPPADDPDSEDPDPEDPEVPTGAVTVDAGALAALQADAAAGRAARDQQIAADDLAEVSAAIKDGRIPSRSLKTYMAQMGRDREGTKAFLASLEKNVIPVTLRGEDGTAAAVATHGPNPANDAFLQTHMPDVWARKQAAMAGPPNRIMTDK